MKSRYTNVKYHCEISWYFSVHCLSQSLRNYKEEAKIKPSEKALAMPGQKSNHTDDGVHLILIYEDFSYIFTFALEYVWSIQNQ